MSDLRPAWLAKWSALLFAVGMLFYLLSNADAADAVLFTLLFLPWLAGPALVAAYLARRTHASWAAWALFVIELAVVVSTLGLWAYLDSHPDAQNGIAMAFFPALQFPAVLVASLAVFALEHLLAAKDPR